MKKQLLLALAVAGLALASAKSYSINLSQPAMLGATTLAPGDYRVEVVDQKADTKYNATSVRFDVADGKMHIQEIHIGGTKTKLVFNE